MLQVFNFIFHTLHIIPTFRLPPTFRFPSLSFTASATSIPFFLRKEVIELEFTLWDNKMLPLCLDLDLERWPRVYLKLRNISLSFFLISSICSIEDLALSASATSEMTRTIIYDIICLMLQVTFPKLSFRQFTFWFSAIFVFFLLILLLI